MGAMTLLDSWGESHGRIAAVRAVDVAEPGGRAVMVAHADGQVRVWDSRMSGTPAMAWSVKDSEILGVRVAKGKSALPWRRALSASRAGLVSYFDMRVVARGAMPAPTDTMTLHVGELSAFAAHASAPLLAASSKTHILKVVTAEGATLCSLRRKEGWGAKNYPRVGCIAFDPHDASAYLGIGNGVRVYSQAVG